MRTPPGDGTLMWNSPYSNMVQFRNLDIFWTTIPVVP
jgi:hypothetical protein